MDWTLSSLVSAASVDAALDGDAAVSGLAYDSRAVAPGDLFCCVPGQVADGHDFATAAVAAGASALLVERAVAAGVPEARVGSVRGSLGPLSDAFFGHPSREMPVAAVTGTNGKTTVSFLLESIGRAAGLEPGLVGTVVRRFKGSEHPAPRSTPEAVDLQRLLREMHDAGVGLVVLEATSDGLAQGRLRGTRFHTAAFTNLTQDHLNTHGTMEAYFEAKASLFEAAYTSRAVINTADPYGRRIDERVSGSLDVLTYEGDGADVVCERAELGPQGSRATIRTPAGTVDLDLKLVGRHNVSNAMCALAMALQIGIAADVAADGIARLELVAGRLERVEAGQPFTVLVDYAHTTDALAHALRAARELGGGRLIAVFGCGGDRDREKRPQMGKVATSTADLTIITSDNPRTEDPDAIIDEIRVGAERGGGAYRLVPDRREAIRDALADARAGDVVVIAGKGHERGQTIGTRTLPFDDVVVARELLGETACRA